MVQRSILAKLSALKGQFGAPKPKWPVTDPVIAHVHVPKCGGTSFRNFLIEHNGPAHLALYVPDTFFVYTPHQVAEHVRDRSVRGFSSHFVRTFPQQIAGRDMVYITFLRHPVEQFISYITHVKKHFDRIPDRPLLELLPPDPTKMSVREIARWILTCDRPVQFHENYTVNFFARYSVPGESGPFRMDKRYLRRRLSAAKRILNSFFFVGITDVMDRSIAVLRNMMAQTQLPFPHGQIPVHNASSEFRDDLSWVHDSDEVGRLLLNSVREDQELYRWALARFQTLERRFLFREF